MLNVERISFGFPQNVRAECTIDTLEAIKKNDYTNKNVDLHLNIDKLLKKNFDKEKTEKEIAESTNASSVRITFHYNTQDNVRSREIAEQTNIIDKAKAYFSLNGISYKESVIEKIKDIQENILLESFTPHDTFTLEYISIRGSIGIRDGQGKDEISFNLMDDFSEGVIGITGPTGGGKSTLIENMHPYPCMLTRPGTLKDNFCLSDSHRILVYHTSNGSRLKISMFINATAKSVMTKYLVETQKEGEGWKPLTEVDGSNESYVKWVNSTFGPKELFMRTSFYAKDLPKNVPDLSQATKGEKLELFSVLAGLDYLTVISDQAHELSRSREKFIEKSKEELKDFDRIDSKIEELKKTVEDNKKEVDSLSVIIDTDTKELDVYKVKQQDFIKAAATYDIYRRELNEKRNELKDLEKKIVQHTNNIEAYEAQMEDMEEYKRQISWWDESMKKRRELNKEDSDLRDKFNNIQATVDLKQDEIDKHKDKLSSLKSELKDISKDINILTSSIPTVNDVCPVCGAPISQHKKEDLEKEIENIKSKISDLEDKRLAIGAIIHEEEKWIEENSIQNYKTELSNLNKKIASIHNEIKNIDEDADEIDIDEAKDIVSNCESNLNNEKSIVTDMSKNLDTIKVRISELEDNINNIPEDFTDKINRLTRGIENTRVQISDLNAEISYCENELVHLAQSEILIKDIKKKCKEAKADIQEYELIHKTFSSTGIQIHELNSAAPEISDIANAILLETYGDRFTISFDTQRDTKDGHKIDDFVIMVFDSKCGRNKRLDLISSGEGALIKQALYYAFSVIRTRRTGFCFKTRFLDESDSSLDSSLRVNYLRMIEAAHKQCFAYQSFLITHSQEVKDIIEQKIEL